MNTTLISINTDSLPQRISDEKTVAMNVAATSTAPAFYASGASMTSREISELVGSRHDTVKQSIERLAAKGVIVQPPVANEQTPDSMGRMRTTSAYVFSGDKGRRDSIIVVAQICPEFTATIVDRWQELEKAQTLQLPDFTDPVAAARAWADQFEKSTQVTITNQHLMQAITAVEQKHDTFKDIRGCGETFATINEVTKATGIRHGFWALKKWCEENDAPRKEVQLTNETFTYAYPNKAWMDVHGLDLTKIFGEKL